MKALIYASPQTPRLVETKKPTIQNPTDAIVKLVHSSVCGTDLHILNGDVPTAKPGLIMGHEGVGKIIEMGSAVDGFNVGDNVLISCVTSCGVCSACRKGMSSHCRTGGWILGNGINGTQAEYVRIPHATSSLYRLPADMDLRAAVILSDALPTAMECGTTNADVKPGSSVVIIGAGPVGLAVLLTAKLLTPAKLAVVDLDDFRLAQAKDMGADETFNPSKPGTTEAIMASTEGQGFDCVIEAVGISKTFEQAQSLLAPGGNLANVGVHGVKTDLHLEKLWDRNICMPLISREVYFSLALANWCSYPYAVGRCCFHTLIVESLKQGKN